MTLPEVTISVVITGIVVATLSMATTVILRQMDNTEGRTNNARSEQNVGLFMPADLSSAETVDTTPGAVPCGPTPACPASANIGGSNALMLTWTGSVFDVGTNAMVSTLTVVSYRVVQTVDGEFQMVRVECYSVGGGAPSCETRIVLRELDAPPNGTEWIPGVTAPAWIMTVSQAAAADDTSGPGVTTPVVDPGLQNKNAQRVVVTINGGGDVAGAGGGQNQISLSAGGTNRDTNLTTDDLAGAPTFTAARSRCGGNFGIIADTSGSIGDTNMAKVRTGVTEFIKAFEGTPVKVQVVVFDDTATTLGAGGGWTKYYDMLVESDVTELKGLVNPTNFDSGGYTNWEDGFFRMLRNSDGTVQSQLPNTILFFTDGMPTRSRLEGTTASEVPVADPLDNGLGGPNSSYYQVGWNRTERLIRDRGSIDIVGVYIGDDTSQSTWSTPGSGYHYVYEIGNAVVYEYKVPYERGNTVIYQRGYHTLDEIGNTVVFERGYHAGYSRNANVTYQYSGTGITYERKVSGTWGSVSRSTYTNNNTVPDESDNYRARVTGALGSWTTMPQADYVESNAVAASTDGFRSTVGALSSSWTSITAAEYNLNNTTADETDGWSTNVYTSPYSSWVATDAVTYESLNTTTDATDGLRTRTTGTPTSWATTTASLYAESNTTADESDGWRSSNVYTAPYSLWQTTDVDTYNANNTASGGADGWQTSTSGSATSWTAVDQATYNLSNTNTGSSDGWRTYTGWALTTQALYEASNVDSGETDNWRTTVPTGQTNTAWTVVTEAQYTASNETTNSSDGWRSTKTYSEPFTYHDATNNKQILNYALVGNLVVDNTTGNMGNFVIAQLDAPQQHYTNAATADLFKSTDYTLFGEALASVALDQCGGTVTMQTKVGTSSAQDPFTYENTSTHEVVQTSAAYRSGTFDVALPGGSSTTITISPQDFTNLVRYQPAGWSCKSQGSPYAFTVDPIPGHAPWTSITMTVGPNQAVSCIQQVTLT